MLERAIHKSSSGRTSSDDPHQKILPYLLTVDDMAELLRTSRKAIYSMAYRGALRDHRHLRGTRVLSQQDGRPLTQKIVQVLVRKAARKANLANGGVHVLRHTFCSHLAMRGAPARTIQELAGHKDITTTQRYMHLSPAAVVSAIRLLENRDSVSASGDIVETGSDEKFNVRN